MYRRPSQAACRLNRSPCHDEVLPCIFCIRCTALAHCTSRYCTQGGLHEAELQRQQADIEAIAADAAEESKVNREVAKLVVQRLEDGRG